MIKLHFKNNNVSNVPPSLAAVFECLLETQDLSLQLYLNLQCVEKSGGKYILKDFFLNLTFYDFNNLILNNLILELFIHCVSIPRQHAWF